LPTGSEHERLIALLGRVDCPGFFFVTVNLLFPAALMQKSPGAAKIRNTRAPGPHGGAILHGTHRGELVGRGRNEVGSAYSLAPSTGARGYREVRGDRAMRVPITPQNVSGWAHKRAKTGVKLNWQP
jgi:hypothetical protein